MGLPLFERYPALHNLSWLPLAELPTPLERITVRGREFLIKRDDQTSREYGGNKVRKLEFILAYARERGATRLITAGAAGSHHALATALFGGKAGFKVTLVLFPQPFTRHVREVLLADHALGAELRFAPRMTAVPTSVAATRLAYLREDVHVVPPGGSDPRGTLGYVNAMLELDDQLGRDAAKAPDAIVTAAGTMGTAAGLAIGAELLGWPTTIAAIRITSRLVTNEGGMSRLIRATCALLRANGVDVDERAANARITLVHTHVGAGYGKPTPAADAATEAFASHGIDLDPTYTAKAAAALLERDDLSRVLYWHTLSGAVPELPPRDPALLPRKFREYLELE